MDNIEDNSMQELAEAFRELSTRFPKYGILLLTIVSDISEDQVRVQQFAVGEQVRENANIRIAKLNKAIGDRASEALSTTNNQQIY